MYIFRTDTRGGTMIGFIKRIFGSDQQLVQEPRQAAYRPRQPDYKELSSEEVKAKVTAGTATILDVRTREEHAQCHINGSTLLPLQDLEMRHSQLDKTHDYVVVCEHGIRSADAASFLTHHGFTKVATLKGGLAEYTGETVQKAPSPFQLYQGPSEPATGGGCCGGSPSSSQDKPSGGGCACCS